MANRDSNEPAPRSGLLVILLFLVLLGVFALNRWGSQPQRESDVSAEQTFENVEAALGVTLEMEIDGQRVQSIVVKPPPEGTVLDAMQGAAHATDDWRFRYQGSGAGAFLEQLAGLKNEGASGRNWLYEVNGKPAIESFGAQQLEPGDRVLWKFAAYE